MRVRLLSNGGYVMLRNSEVTFPVEVEVDFIEDWDKSFLHIQTSELIRVGFTYMGWAKTLPFKLGLECEIIKDVSEIISKKLIGFKIKNNYNGYWYRSYCKGMSTYKEDAHIYPADFLASGDDRHCYVKESCTLFPVYK